VLFLVDSCIPARQWTDICNTRCSILSRFSHFHVSHFPPLQHSAAFSCPAISCLAFSASPCTLPSTGSATTVMQHFKWKRTKRRMFLSDLLTSDWPTKQEDKQHVVQTTAVNARSVLSCLNFYCTRRPSTLFSRLKANK